MTSMRAAASTGGDYRDERGPTAMRRVGVEPTSACAQWILNPSPLPVWTPPLDLHFDGSKRWNGIEPPR
jgi:hypothetical protein